MSENVFVSVLMTCYNREDFIVEAIESVLASSYTNFELIICDDASSDSTVSIVKTYELKDKRIRFYINDENVGDYINRNKAASFAKGKYLKYLDSDDKISIDGLAKMVAAMEAYPHAALGIAQYDTIENTEINFPVCITPQQAYLEHYDGQGILRYGPTGTIIRRDVFFDLNCFAVSRFLGDTEFWLKVASLYPIVKIEPGVVWWRIHEGQEYQIGHKNHSYLRYAYPIYIKSLLSTQCPLPAEDVKRIISRLKWKHARDILKLLAINGKVFLALKIFKESNLSIGDLLKGLLPYKRVKKNFLKPQ